MCFAARPLVEPRLVMWQVNAGFKQLVPVSRSKHTPKCALTIAAKIITKHFSKIKLTSLRLIL